MKSIISIILFSICFNSFAQIDSSLDYKERFYFDEQLIAPNVLLDSLKDGKWIEYYDEKWNESTKKRSKYFRLIEYKNGTPVGKVYDFYNSNQLQMVGQFLSLYPEIRKGTFTWFSKQGIKRNLIHYSIDSVINQNFYKNGTLKFQEISLRNWDEYTYVNFRGYFKNGNIQWIDYSNAKEDSSNRLFKRKNGTITYQDISSKDYYSGLKENRKGKVIEKRTNTLNLDIILVETYKNNHLVKSKLVAVNDIKNSYLDKYNAIVYYRMGTVNDSVLTEVNYKENGQITISKAQVKDRKRDRLKRQKAHYYKEFSNDSILLFEGLYKNIDQPCGVYVEYFPNGIAKVRGRYDKKGRKTGAWSYYNESGEFIYIDFYTKGVKDKLY